MSNNVRVSLDQELLQIIFESARKLYPKETLLLLRGKKKKDLIQISELVVPPLATHGQGFVNAPLYMLPIDFSIVGTVHSHPSGNLMPSVGDLNHSIGRIIMIVGFPFADEQNIAVYSRRGERLKLQVAEN